MILIGLRVTGDPSGASASERLALEIADNAGSIRLVDRSFRGQARVQNNCAAGMAVDLRTSPDVVFSRCEMAGGDGGGFAAFIANEFQQSKVALYDCLLLGGNSQNGAFDGTGFCTPPDSGHAAAPQQSSFVFASGFLFEGGDGGWGSAQGGFGCACGIDGGSGGSGLRVFS